MNYNQFYFHLKKCIIRTPILPLKFLFYKIDINVLENKSNLIDYINNVLSVNYLRKALIISYPDFFNELLKNTNNEDADYDKLLRNCISLHKFLIRSSYRATPYGMFSGISIAEISDETDLILEKKSLKFDIQPNIYEYYNLINDIEFDVFYKNNILFYVTPSLYQLNSKYFYIEKSYVLTNQSSLVNITTTPILKLIINSSKNGISLKNLIELVHKKFDYYSEQEIKSFIESIIKSQILISELFINPHEGDFCNSILNKLYEVKRGNTKIEKYYKKISLLNTIRLNNNIDELIDKKDTLDGINFGIDTKITDKNLKISTQLIDEISQQCFELYIKLKGNNSSQLNVFVDKFLQRYEYAEIPLLEALDSNYGIGFAESSIGNSEYQPLKEGFYIKTNELQKNKNILEELVEEIFIKYLEKKVDHIDIEEYILKLSSPSNQVAPLNESAYIFGKVNVNKSNEFTFFPDQIFSSQASKLIKRFSHLDKQVEGLINDIYKEEVKVNKDHLLAEVVNVPNHEFANLVLTKNQRNYEIPYYTINSKRSKNISLNDLLIKIIDGKIRLISKALNKEIIPIISNTYNTQIDDPIYKFLSEVANQYSGGGNFWNWGKYQYYGHLPRISYKNIIISRECWFLKKEENSYQNVRDANTFINKIISDNNLPRFVSLTLRIGADNEMFLDLENPISKLILAKELQRHNVFLLEENFRDNQLIEDENENFYNSELVIPFINKFPKFNDSLSITKNKEKRFFLPTDEWLYIKVYSGSKDVEKILADIILPISNKLKKDGIIDYWFFIKYLDPDYHIRLRFHRAKNATDYQWNSVLNIITLTFQKKLSNNFYYKVIVDTYIREIERYGIIDYSLTEKLFHVDSECIASFIKDLNGNEGEVYRYKFAFLNVDNFLDQFNYSLEDKKLLLNKMSNDFYVEFKKYFNEEKSYRGYLNNKYRELRNEISEVLNESTEINNELISYLKVRNNFIQKNIKNYSEYIDELMYSYVHMTLNRLFLIRPRENELIVYYLLNKYYESEIAKIKYNK
ncbi:thiopeptide-type bacteriocin biosynthesis protein [Chishuiella sp.]|uniref:lantibiotic dehydratase n=1 Tax=Chishuiella sp. TaxID=1969467 RepID=UPI0028AD9473|nr:thiopeptide-type bacteriocin biosynthesis protein [Chishuiella sp.]